MSSKFSGQLTRCIAYLGAALFIGVSAAQNVSHGYNLGLARSELAALIFAAGSLAGALMGPVSFLAAWNAFRNWRLGSGVVAVALGCCCVIYAGMSSLGFVGTARDTASATRSADADAYSIAKAKAQAATTELKALADAPRGSRKDEDKRSKRRGELEKTISDAEKVMAKHHGAGTADPTAAALAAYAATLGFAVTAEALAPWLVLLSVIFFELGAAASLIVVGALPSAEAPVAAAEKKAAGRRRSKPLNDVMEKLKGAGGTLEGSIEAIGQRLGLSKSSAHRALHALSGLGAVTLATSAAGTLVQLR